MIMTFAFGNMFTANAMQGMAQKLLNNESGTQSALVDLNSLNSEVVTFIVEVEGEPLAVQSEISGANDAEKTSKLLYKQQMVMSQINDKVDENAKKGFVYTTVFNGFSVEANIDQLDEIKALDGVKNVYISSEMQIIKPVYDETITPMLDSADSLTNTDFAYDLGYNGEGTVIAIVDAGCDTSHEFFLTPPVNPRYSKDEMDEIIKNSVLNADVDSANNVYKNEKIPYAYNYCDMTADTYMSTQEHGNHVAGIAAGKNGTLPDNTKFSGVAPEAQLLILSCGSRYGTFSTADIMAAINDAIVLGADVINMSFGLDYQDTNCDTLYSTVLENAQNAGITVTAANGNSSRGFYDDIPYTDRPDYSAAGTPSGFEKTTAVASCNNSNVWNEYVALVSPDDDVFKTYTAHKDNPIKDAFTLDEYLEYVDCNLGYAEDFEGKDLSGKIAVVKRGVLSFTEKADNAKSAGAVGIIIYNTNEEIFGCATALSLPAATASLSTGMELIAYENKKLCFKGEMIEKNENTYPAKISEFSSWGVDSTLSLKPEITAPGGSIYSSVPDDKYESISGTSMASPYMAGISALSRQYYRTNPFLDEFNLKTGREKVLLLENLAMNSADIIRQENGVPYSPRVQGAGLVDMEGIIKSRVLLSGDRGKAKISLGDDLTDSITIEFDITNLSDEMLTFDKISVEVFTDGYTKSGNKYLVSDSVYIPVVSDNIPKTIEIASGNTETFSATINLSSEFIDDNSKIFTNGFFIDGYVILDTLNSTTRASLPFTGFYGDWGSSPIFDSTIYDDGGSYLVDPEGIGGTYLALNLEEYIMPLGQNPLFSNTLDKKYIAYSANLECPLALIMTNFRAINNIVKSVTDDEGNEIISGKITGNLQKFAPYIIYFQPDALKSLKEGNYNFNISASVLGDTEKTDELSIPFTIDNTYPEILSAVYDKNDNTVTITAKENHYFLAFYVSYKENSEQKYKYVKIDDGDYTQDGTVTKVIDVSMIENISDAEIGCIDYAYNETYYDMDYFLDRVGTEFTSIEQLSSMTQAELCVRNNTSEELNGDFVLAFYDNSDNIVATSIKNDFKIGANQEEELVYSFFNNTLGASYVKLFVWDFDKMYPVDVFKQFNLNN